MYNFTLFGEKVKSPLYSLGLKNISKNLFKSKIGITVMILFLLCTTAVNAQFAPCIDGNSNEWDDLQVTGNPTYELRMILLKAIWILFLQVVKISKVGEIGPLHQIIAPGQRAQCKPRVIL